MKANKHQLAVAKLETALGKLENLRLSAQRRPDHHWYARLAMDIAHDLRELKSQILASDQKPVPHFKKKAEAAK